jgi:hypothetical protein
MAYTPDAEVEHAPEVPATDARQGRWGRHALWMLLASLALVFIALFGTWWARSGDLRAVDHKARVTAGEEQTSPTPLVQPKNKASDVRPTDLNR